jgi:hypothetical protein
MTALFVGASTTVARYSTILGTEKERVVRALHQREVGRSFRENTVFTPMAIWRTQASTTLRHEAMDTVAMAGTMPE